MCNDRKGLQQAIDEICKSYCKYPERYHVRGEEMTERHQKLFDEKCENCPLVRYVNGY